MFALSHGSMGRLKEAFPHVKPFVFITYIVPSKITKGFTEATWFIIVLYDT